VNLKKEVSSQLDSLSEAELHQVIDRLALLKHKSRIKPAREYDEDRLATLYREFAEEDRELAEEGMMEYADGLAKGDAD